MSELIIQDKYTIQFFTNRTDGLKYQEVKANTVSEHLIILNDLLNFISKTELNKKPYKTLLRNISTHFGEIKNYFLKKESYYRFYRHSKRSLISTFW